KLLGIVVLAQARVRLAVRRVWAVAPRLDDERLLRRRVRAELLQRRRRCGCSSAARLRLREQGERLVDRDREQLLLALEGTSLGAFLDIRPEAPVQRDDLFTVRPLCA